MTKNKKIVYKIKIFKLCSPVSGRHVGLYHIHHGRWNICGQRSRKRSSGGGQYIDAADKRSFRTRHTLCRGSQHKGFYLQRTKRREEGRQSIYSQHRYCGLRRTHCGGGSHVEPYKRGKTLRATRRNHGICQELSGRNNHVCTVLYDVVTISKSSSRPTVFLKRP